MHSIMLHLLAVCLMLVPNHVMGQLPALPDSLFNTLQSNHPRLLISNSRLQSLHSDESKTKDIGEGIKYLRQRGEEILTQPPVSFVTGDMLETSRQVLERIFDLAFLARYDKDQRWVDRAIKEMTAVAGFPNWNPADFLSVAEMTAAFSIGYDWLYEYMTFNQRTAVRNAIRTKGFQPALTEFEQKKFWTDSPINWNPVCNSSLALAALSVGKEEPMAQSLMHRALLSLQESGALEAYGPDGAYAEGIGYWCYSTQYLTMLISSLQSALGNDFGFSKVSGLSLTGLFPIYCEGTSHRMFNYADSRDNRIFPYWMAGMGAAYQMPVYAWYSQKNTGFHVLDILWFDPKASDSNPSYLPRSRRFRGSELAVFRGSWTDSNASYLAFKAGGLTNEHTHLDAGSFVFDALGERWAVDMGPDDYSLPGYFIDYQDSARRFEYYRIRAEGQNTLTLKPGMGPDQERSAASEITQFDSTRMRAIGNLTPAYSSVAQKVLRGVTLINGKTALIQDEILMRESGDIWWRMHTEAKVKLSSDGVSAELESHGKRLWVKLLKAPWNSKFTVNSAEPIAGTPRPSGQNVNAGISVLAIQLQQSTSASLAIWMVPLEPGELPPLLSPSLDSLTLSGWTPSGIQIGPRLRKSASQFHRASSGWNFSKTHCPGCPTLVTDLAGRDLKIQMVK